MKTAFTLWDAQLSIYLEGSTVPLFYGGCAEKLDIGRTYVRTALRRPGHPYARLHASDESHTIKIQNVWTFKNGAMPDWARRDRYILTVLWQDTDTGAWAKCSWHGVTLSDDGEDGVNAVMQEMNFSAEYRTLIKTGLGASPGLLPLEPTAEVWYVDAPDRIRLYTYDDDTQLLVPDNMTMGRATISLAGNQLLVWFGDDAPVITVEAGVFTCATLDGLHTYGDIPGLEFWRGPRRFATLSADGGVFSSNFIEASTPPAGADQIALISGVDWQCSIGRAGITAASFVETA